MSQMHSRYLPTTSSSSPWSSDLELTFSTEPVVGWRVWRGYAAADGDWERDAVLHSSVVAAEWPAGERMEGRCEHLLHVGDQVPGHNCACGVWALRTAHALRRRRVVRPNLSEHGFAVVGKVALWGRVLEFEEGWRGRYAYPLELDLLVGERHDPDVVRDFADALMARYGVQVNLAPEEEYLDRQQIAAIQKALIEIDKALSDTAQQVAAALTPGLKAMGMSMAEAQKQFDATMRQLASLQAIGVAAYAEKKRKLRVMKAALRVMACVCAVLGVIDIFVVDARTVGIADLVVVAVALVALWAVEKA